MLREFLKKLHFTEGEVKVYEYLLSKTEDNAKNISLNSELSLSKTYEILERLELKHLLSKIIKNNKKYYRTFGIDSLQNLLDTQKNTILESEQHLKELSKTHQIKKEESNSTQIRLFSGYQGIKIFYKELEQDLNSNEYLGFMIDSEITKNKTILRLLDNFHKLRSEDGKVSKILIEETSNYNTKRINSTMYSYYEFRSTIQPFPKNLSIIGDKVIHYNINVDEEKFEIIETTSPSLAHMYRELFLKLWTK
jgi:sugar-specific transcriptional regulator TrmB